jgi:TPR repeat protein
VPKDHKEAVKWFLRAAEGGNLLAQLYLGSMFLEGQGVDQDFSKAAEWFRLAAEKGETLAQYNLGCLLLFARAWTRTSRKPLNGPDRRGE